MPLGSVDGPGRSRTAPEVATPTPPPLGALTTGTCDKLTHVGDVAEADQQISRVSAETRAAHTAFLAALGDGARISAGALGTRPLVLHCSTPLPSLLRVYLYRPTAPPSERKDGTYRIQVTGLAPNRTPGHFDWTRGGLPILAGFEPELRVFILWDAGIYDQGNGVVWSRNVQVAGQTLFRAMASGTAEETRHLRSQVDEVVVACTARHLQQALLRRWELTVGRLIDARPVP